MMDFFKIAIHFCFAKLFFLFFLFASHDIFSVHLFSGGDFDNYVSLAKLDNLPSNAKNIGFIYLLDVLNLESQKSYLSILLASSFGFLTVVNFFYALKNKISLEIFIIFVWLINIHPYFGAYSFRISPDIFVCYAASCVFLLFFLKSYGFIIFNCVVVFSACIIKYSTLPLLLPILLKDGRKNIFLSLGLIFLLGFFGVSLDLIQYAKAILSEVPSRPWSGAYIGQYFDISEGPLTSVLSSMVKFFMFFGFREAFFVEGLEFFDRPTAYFEFVIMALLSMFHIVGIFLFIRFGERAWVISIPLVAYAVYCMFSVSHMRYFLPFIPFACHGWIYLMEIYREDLFRWLNYNFRT